MTEIMIRVVVDGARAVGWQAVEVLALAAAAGWIAIALEVML